LICYDLTAESTFNKVKAWVTEIKNNEPDCVLYIVGTKVDMLHEGALRAVSLSTLKEYANSVKAKTFETSAKTGEGVDDLFNAVAIDYVRTNSSKLPTYNNVVKEGNQSFCSCT